jgi:hypothetical protein
MTRDRCGNRLRGTDWLDILSRSLGDARGVGRHRTHGCVSVDDFGVVNRLLRSRAILDTRGASRYSLHGRAVQCGSCVFGLADFILSGSLGSGCRSRYRTHGCVSLDDLSIVDRLLRSGTVFDA